MGKYITRTVNTQMACLFSENDGLLKAVDVTKTCYDEKSILELYNEFNSKTPAVRCEITETPTVYRMPLDVFLAHAEKAESGEGN